MPSTKSKRVSISQKEEPFDVFICYKETDNNGRRTPDSVLANDLYHQLTQEGFKVFFSRITLEDKLGAAYEPYIFAALNSAKVMVVLGTKPEYFNAVWVKNEWSRYLALIKNGANKALIPAYRDMDPYDLPEEFSHLQAQDMSKLGFMQDLIRGIQKLTAASSRAEPQTVEPAVNASITPLLKRAFLFLEDSAWKDADEYCEKVLDQDPENPQAYLGKLLVEMQVKRPEELMNCPLPFDTKDSYHKILRFAGEPLKLELAGYLEHINTRNETDRKESIYTKALSLLKSAKEEREFLAACEKFQSISGYRDADALAQQCREQAEDAQKDAIYNNARREMAKNTIPDLEKAIRLMGSIPGWKDSQEQIAICRQRMEKINAENQRRQMEHERQMAEWHAANLKRKKRNRGFALIAASIACAVVAFIIVLNTVIIPNNKYNSAIALLDTGKYEEAYQAFKDLGDYKDSIDKSKECSIAVLGEEKWNKINNANAGDILEFGSYEQDNNTANGKEAVEWLVLEVNDGKALVISKYALDTQPYNTRYTSVTWETCSLRKWLNNHFLDEAFSKMEKAMIPTVTVAAEKNPSYSTNPGNAEANRYFRSDSARECKPTNYAAANEAYVDSDNGNCWWWLRSPGCFHNIAAGVDYDGDVFELGDVVDYDARAVRPALWIDLNA